MNFKRLIMLKGLPGSGKTYYAKELQKDNIKLKRVNKDDLRAMLDDSRWSKENERFVIQVRDFIISRALAEGFSIIVDDTNFDIKHQVVIETIGSQFDIQLEGLDFDTPVYDCIERDSKRQNPVGKKVILDMWRRYLRKSPEPIVSDPKLPNAIIVDLDGTLALFDNKNPFDRDFENDRINESVKLIVDALRVRGSQIIVMSGRSAKYQHTTVDWLIRNNIIYKILLMRKEFDMRKDYFVKKEMFDAEVKGKFNVQLVIDDRPQVLKLWRELGIPTFDCGDGIDF